MNILSLLYTDIRSYLLHTFNLPTTDATIIRGYNNLNPIPIDAIIMTFRNNAHLDQKSTAYKDDKMIIFNSVRGTMQLDFYGDKSFDRAQEISTLWNTIYTTTILKNCVPLDTPRLRDLSFVNEGGMYEYRFMLDVELQYNTKYEKTVNIATDVSEIDSELINVQFNSSE